MLQGFQSNQGRWSARRAFGGESEALVILLCLSVLLKGSWDLVTWDINKVTILILTYNPY